MFIWVFSSKISDNIRIGYENQMWAVSDKVDDPAFMQQRFTKSRSMHVGSYGLLYCSEKNNKFFTVPFKVLTQPESPTSTISDIWLQKWGLPFKINPLGPPNRRVSLHTATHQWPIFREVETVDNAAVNAPAFMNGISGRTQFLPTKISEKDWAFIIKDLGFNDPPVYRADIVPISLNGLHQVSEKK